MGPAMLRPFLSPPKLNLNSPDQKRPKVCSAVIEMDLVGVIWFRKTEHLLPCDSLWQSALQCARSTRCLWRSNQGKKQH